jgi:hypothetical protein
MKTTKRYPITRTEALSRIAQSSLKSKNVALAPMSYRNAGVRECDGLVAYSFVESPRTPGAFRVIPFAS